MNLSERQQDIVNIVRTEGPITGESIANRLNLTRSALRSDLTVLTMLQILDARPKVGYFYIGSNTEKQAAQILHQYSVGQVASQAVVVTPSTTLYDTIVTIFTEDVGTILVGEEGILAGVVSRKDLLRAAVGKNDPHTVPISMIMTPASKVVYVEPEEQLIVAAQKMDDFEVDCLPVVHREEVDHKRQLRIVGRVSKTNIMKVFLELSRM
ncbi:MAG: helix-turn-helix transcriptional regulator [Veillonella sp.]|nr:helix-turn-helix transcriptional regulator [Veillonella sp.]